MADQLPPNKDSLNNIAIKNKQTFKKRKDVQLQKMEGVDGGLIPCEMASILAENGFTSTTFMLVVVVTNWWTGDAWVCCVKVKSIRSKLVMHK